jgi:tetratricopeptide (TPR) repeat protein
MLDEAAAALATAAGNALISAMVSDAWTSFKGVFARLLARGEPSQSGETERQLELEHSKLVALSQAERERLAAELEPACRRRFADLLREEPSSAGEIRALVEHVSAVLPVLTWAPVAQDVLGFGQAKQAVLGQGVQNNSFDSGMLPAAESAVNLQRVEPALSPVPIGSGSQRVTAADRTWQAVAGPGGTQVNYWGINPLSPDSPLSIAAPLGRRDEALPLRGRAALLDELIKAWRAALPPRVRVLHGLGGCGKTSLALEAARLAADEGAEVWWLSATDGGTLLAGMHAVARRLGVTKDLLRYGDVADMIWERLSARTQRWLLVIDNADDPTVLALGSQPLRDGNGWIRPVESTSGLVLITSRDGQSANWGPWCRLHRVTMLTAAAAADVLTDHAREAGSRREAEQLGRRLGRLPLALRLAGSYLAEARAVPAAFAGADAIQTFTGYLRALDYGRFDTLLAAPEAGALSEEQARSLIGRTWKISLNLLERNGTGTARQLLHFLACFADAPVPYELLLHPGLMAAAEPFSDITGPLIWHNLRALADFGLIDLMDAQQANQGVPLIRVLQVHPLIRDIGCHEVDVEQKYDTYLRLAALSVERTTSREAGIPEDPRQWPLWQVLTPHAVHLLVALETRPTASGDTLRHAADAIGRCARYLSAKGLHEQAEDLYRSALRIYERILPADDPAALGARQDIAWEVAQQGDYARAEAMYHQVLEANIRVMGAYDPSTLAARHEIARVEARRGNYAEADILLREILDAEMRFLHADHPAALVTRHEIARIAAERSDYPRAEELYRAVVEAKTRILGADHPSTLASRHSVAWVVTQRGDFPRAEELYRAVVEAKTRVLGVDHPSTLASQHDIAWITARKGDFGRAEALFNENLKSKVRVLGADHPSTLVTRHSMAWVSAQRAGDYLLAEELYQEILRAKAQISGTDRPDRVAAQT